MDYKNKYILDYLRNGGSLPKFNGGGILSGTDLDYYNPSLVENRFPDYDDSNNVYTKMNDPKNQSGDKSEMIFSNLQQAVKDGKVKQSEYDALYAEWQRLGEPDLNNSNNSIVTAISTLLGSGKMNDGRDRPFTLLTHPNDIWVDIDADPNKLISDIADEFMHLNQADKKGAIKYAAEGFVLDGLGQRVPGVVPRVASWLTDKIGWDSATDWIDENVEPLFDPYNKTWTLEGGHEVENNSGNEYLRNLKKNINTDDFVIEKKQVEQVEQVEDFSGKNPHEYGTNDYYDWNKRRRQNMLYGKRYGGTLPKAQDGWFNDIVESASTVLNPYNYEGWFDMYPSVKGDNLNEAFANAQKNHSDSEMFLWEGDRYLNEKKGESKHDANTQAFIDQIMNSDDRRITDEIKQNFLEEYTRLNNPAVHVYEGDRDYVDNWSGRPRINLKNIERSDYQLLLDFVNEAPHIEQHNTKGRKEYLLDYANELIESGFDQGSLYHKHGTMEHDAHAGEDIRPTIETNIFGRPISEIGSRSNLKVDEQNEQLKKYIGIVNEEDSPVDNSITKPLPTAQSGLNDNLPFLPNPVDPSGGLGASLQYPNIDPNIDNIKFSNTNFDPLSIPGIKFSSDIDPKILNPGNVALDPDGDGIPTGIDATPEGDSGPNFNEQETNNFDLDGDGRLTDKEVWASNKDGVQQKYNSFEEYQQAAEKYRNPEDKTNPGNDNDIDNDGVADNEEPADGKVVCQQCDPASSAPISQMFDGPECPAGWEAESDINPCDGMKKPEDASTETEDIDKVKPGWHSPDIYSIHPGIDETALGALAGWVHGAGVDFKLWDPGFKRGEVVEEEVEREELEKESKNNELSELENIDENNEEENLNNSSQDIDETQVLDEGEGSFDEAFAKHREQLGPGKTFTWNGKSYTTWYEGEEEASTGSGDGNGDGNGDAVTPAENIQNYNQEMEDLWNDPNGDSIFWNDEQRADHKSRHFNEDGSPKTQDQKDSDAAKRLEENQKGMYQDPDDGQWYSNHPAMYDENDQLLPQYQYEGWDQKFGGSIPKFQEQGEVKFNMTNDQKEMLNNIINSENVKKEKEFDPNNINIVTSNDLNPGTVRQDNIGNLSPRIQNLNPNINYVADEYTGPRIGGDLNFDDRTFLEKMEDFQNTDDENLNAVEKALLKAYGHTGELGYRSLSNFIDLLTIPGKVIAEGTEGVTGKGDGTFNFLDALPSMEGNFEFKTAAGNDSKTFSSVLDPEGNWPLAARIAADFGTDPLTYTGIGAVSKLNKLDDLANVTSKITKPVTVYGDDATKSVITTSSDNVTDITTKLPKENVTLYSEEFLSKQPHFKGEAPWLGNFEYKKLPDSYKKIIDDQRAINKQALNKEYSMSIGEMDSNEGRLRLGEYFKSQMVNKDLPFGGFYDSVDQIPTAMVDDAVENWLNAMKNIEVTSDVAKGTQGSAGFATKNVDGRPVVTPKLNINPDVHPVQMKDLVNHELGHHLQGIGAFMDMRKYDPKMFESLVDLKKFKINNATRNADGTLTNIGEEQFIRKIESIGDKNPYHSGNLGYGTYGPIDDFLLKNFKTEEGLIHYGRPTEYMYGVNSPTSRIRNYSQIDPKGSLDYYNFGSIGKEKMPYLTEIRSDMLSRGLIKNRYDKIDDAMMQNYFNKYSSQRGPLANNQNPYFSDVRMLDFMSTKGSNYMNNLQTIKKGLNMLPVALPFTLPMLNQEKEGGDLRKAQSGMDKSDYSNQIRLMEMQNNPDNPIISNSIQNSNNINSNNLFQIPTEPLILGSEGMFDNINFDNTASNNSDLNESQNVTGTGDIFGGSGDGIGFDPENRKEQWRGFTDNFRSKKNKKALKNQEVIDPNDNNEIPFMGTAPFDIVAENAGLQSDFSTIQNNNQNNNTNNFDINDIPLGPIIDPLADDDGIMEDEEEITILDTNQNNNQNNNNQLNSLTQPIDGDLNTNEIETFIDNQPTDSSFPDADGDGIPDTIDADSAAGPEEATVEGCPCEDGTMKPECCEEEDEVVEEEEEEEEKKKRKLDEDVHRNPFRALVQAGQKGKFIARQAADRKFQQARVNRTTSDALYGDDATYATNQGVGRPDGNVTEFYGKYGVEVDDDILGELIAAGADIEIL